MLKFHCELFHRLSLDSSRNRIEGLDFCLQLGLALEHFLTQALDLRTRTLSRFLASAFCLPCRRDFRGQFIQTVFQSGLPPQLTLPHNDHMPAQGLQVRSRHLITMHVALNLCLPEFRIGLGPGRIPASLVSMPEAPVHHYRNPILRQHDIRPPRQSPILQTEPEPTRMQPLPNQNLRLGILPANTGHAVAALGGVKDVGHGAKVGILLALTQPLLSTSVT